MTQQFFVMPDASMEALIGPLRAASHTIDIYVFTFGNRDLLQALGDAVARGVEVRAIVESQPNNNEEVGEAGRRALEHVGVHVHRTPHYFDRVHAKSYVVDDSAALVSTINYLEDWQHTRDYGLITDEPGVVEALRATFDADWHEDERQVSTVPPPPLVLSPNNSRSVVSQLIEDAKSSLVLEEEQINDPDIIEAIAGRANAGVDVTVLANSAQTKNLAALAQLAERAPRARILYMTNMWLHAKLIVADNTLMLMGSLNLTEVSLDKRREVSVLITEPAAIERAMSAVRRDIDAGTATVPDESARPAKPAESPVHMHER